MYDLDVRYDVRVGERHGVEIAQHALLHHARQVGTQRIDRDEAAVLTPARRVQRRHVDARNLGQRVEQRAAITAIPTFVDIADLAQRFLAVAEQHRVEELGERFRVERTRTTGDHQRIGRASIGGAHRDAAEVEHGEDVRVRQLVLQAEADDVELVERRVRLERDQRMVVLAQDRLEVEPGSVGAFGVDVVAPVQQIVEQLQAGMRLSDLVDFGKAERDAELHGARILAHGAELVAQIAPRFFHPGKQAFVALCVRLHRAARRADTMGKPTPPQLTRTRRTRRFAKRRTRDAV